MHATIITQYLSDLRQLSERTLQPVGPWEVRQAEHKGPGEYEYDADWQPLDVHRFLTPDKTAFLRTAIHVPASISSSPEERDSLHLDLRNAEAIVRIDGHVYQGLDANRTLIPLDPAWAGRRISVELEVYARRLRAEEAAPPYLSSAKLVRVDRLIEALYFDLRLAWDTYTVDEATVVRRARSLDEIQRAVAHADRSHLKPLIMRAVDDCIGPLDLARVAGGDRAGVQEARERLRTALDRIDDGDVNGTVHLVGHTHIDVAWLWQFKDTIRKCAHSFGNVLRLMDEHPGFTFACGQPQLFAYTKKHYPDVYDAVKRRVAEGRIELVGPMWVESDCNVVSGESVVRQLLHGQLFYRSEFGRTSDICWLPDTFGFQSNLPQIFAKAGIRRFFTYKVHWQSQNRFPYGSFRWQGIDGTEVLATVPKLMSGYNGRMTPEEVKYAQTENLQKGGVRDVLEPFGWGDGGGGPTHDMLEYAERLEDYPGLPRCRVGTASQFFDTIEAARERLPVWFGELYVETHRGTYTSQSRTKRNNRLAELGLQRVEKLAVLAGHFGMADWPKAQVDAAWRRMLLLQFHDVLPGSSVHEVYRDAEAIYAQVFATVEGAEAEALAFLGAHTGHEGAAAQQAGAGASPADAAERMRLRVLNTLSWQRSGPVAIPLRGPAAQTLAFGEPVSVQAPGGQLEAAVVTERDGERELVFWANDVPPMGWADRSVRLVRPPEDEDAGVAEVLRDDAGITVETERLSVRLDMEGRIARLEDRRENRVVVENRPANELQLFLDGPQREDAWNIYPEYRERRIDTPWTTELALTERNPLRTVVTVAKRFGHSSILQRCIFYSSAEWIEFDTTIEWHERHKVLRVAFPLTLFAPYAAFETGFGTFLRPTAANTPYDQAKFEVSGHKWVDLSEGSYGVSLLNDCKYGFAAEPDCLSMTLVRGTTSPDEDADQGIHRIRYALLPHAGDWREGQTVRRGHELNAPMCGVFPAGGLGAAAGALGPETYSLLGCDSPDVVVDTVKLAEIGRGMVLRLYECNGNRGPAQVRFADPIAGAEETDLLEEHPRKVTSAGDTLTLHFTPYEVKTVRVRLEGEKS